VQTKKKVSCKRIVAPLSENCHGDIGFQFPISLKEKAVKQKLKLMNGFEGDF
jgi:hypothetical protein